MNKICKAISPLPLSWVCCLWCKLVDLVHVRPTFEWVPCFILHIHSCMPEVWLCFFFPCIPSVSRLPNYNIYNNEQYSQENHYLPSLFWVCYLWCKLVDLVELWYRVLNYLRVKSTINKLQFKFHICVTRFITIHAHPCQEPTKRHMTHGADFPFTGTVEPTN